MKVFLGGTCKGYDWRKSLERLLEYVKVDYFNPLVDDWNEAAQKEEERQKRICEIHLYLITPDMEGVFSIAEAVNSAMTAGKKVYFVVCDDGDFSEAQLKSLDAVGNMISNPGGGFLIGKDYDSINSWLVKAFEMQKNFYSEKRFVPGKFYKHPFGRSIAIVDEVETFKWGKLLVVEETDVTGHGISCCGVDALDLNGQWTEISQEEFLSEFNKVYVCFECKEQIRTNQEYRMTQKFGPMHEECFQKIIEEEADEPAENTIQ